MPNLAHKIGITGGIAEGKSTVLAYCREAGYPVCSMDDLARSMFGNRDIQAGLAILFRKTAEHLDRDDVRRAIADNPKLRRGLNRLMHPRLLAALRASDAMIIEVPLLIETCLMSEFGRIWVVTCGPEEQRRRLAERMGEEQAEHLLRMQLPTLAKTPFADAIIRTNEPEEAVMRNVLGLLKSEAAAS